MLKHQHSRKNLLFILLLVCSLVVMSRVVTAQAMSVTLEISDVYPSNTMSRFSVVVSPIPTGSIEIDFNLPWRGIVFNMTDSYGRAFVRIKTPTYSMGSSYTIEVTSPSGSFTKLTKTIQIKIGLKTYLSCYPTQFVNPEGTDDIMLFAYPRETDTNSTISPSSWVVTATLVGTSTTIPGFPEAQSNAGEYKVTFSTDTRGVYDLSVVSSISASNYMTITSTIRVTLSNPRFLVKAVMSGQESWVGYSPDGTQVTAALDATRGTQNVEMYFYNSKGTSMAPDMTTLDFVVKTSTGIELSRSQGLLIVEKIDGRSDAWKILMIFDETAYDVRVIARRGSLYDTFDQTLKVSTIHTGFDIWTFIGNIWIMVPLVLLVLVIILWIGRKLSKKKVVV